MTASQAPCRSVHEPYGDDDAIVARFQQDGYVVVSGVLDDAEVGKALDELWCSPRLLGRSASIRRDDPATWGAEDWPQQDGGRNFLESLDTFQDEACWEIAQHPRVVHLLKLLYSGPVLHHEAGRWGVMRPTKDRPEWRTDESWLHWDQNPWAQPGFARLQCLACLTAQTPTSGGFLCVPGFHKRWRDWGEAHPEGSVTVGGRAITRDFGQSCPFPVPELDPAHQETVRVLAPAGALLLWDGRLPHQNYPNTGGDFRVVHYLQCFPLDPDQALEREEVLRKRLTVMRALGRSAQGAFPKGITPLGREVLAAPAAVDGELEPLDDDLARAIRLVVEAGEEELRGNLTESVSKMQRAGKIWPDIDPWYDAIFGN